jgi:hypothetical protein
MLVKYVFPIVMISVQADTDGPPGHNVALKTRLCELENSSQ